MAKPSPKSFVVVEAVDGAGVVRGEVHFTTRKTLAITVTPDGGVEISAPKGTHPSELTANLQKKIPWIRRQQRHFLKFRPPLPPRQYVSGETHYYRGRQYRLKIVMGTPAGVSLRSGRLMVTTTKPDDREGVREMLEEWYSARAAECFQKLLTAAWTTIAIRPCPAPVLQIRPMRKRWGSFTRGGKVLLNPELIKAPVVCQEYVVVHELCHLVRPDHSRTYFALLGRVMPDWQERKARLDYLGARF